MNAPLVAATPPPLAVLADIASHVGSDEDVVHKARSILDVTRSAFSAEECSLWLYGASGLVCASLSGDALVQASDVQNLLDAGSTDQADVHLCPLESSQRRLGGLVVRLSGAFEPDSRRLFDIIGALLAPALAHAERLHQLSEEVGLRTRQIDSERRFTQKIIDSLPVGLYVIDAEYRVQAWNRNRETGIQGVARDDALGKTIFEILYRQSRETLRKDFDDVFRTGRIQQFNIESEASGQVRTYRITKIPMRVNDGAITHVISIGEDITDWTAAQERFAQSEKLAAIGQLAAGIMHEINNPLATIAACAESLTLRLDDLRNKGCDVPTQTSEFLGIIDNEVDRCKHIVDGVLDFARPKPARKELTDVNAVIEQTVFLVKHHARFKKVQMHMLLDAGVDKVNANAEQLVQVFMALLINGVDSMSDAGHVTIRTRRGLSEAEGVIAEVVDEGHGIARTDLPKIFEPFYTTKPPGRGTGLGLSICYGIIADHGGRIEVDSAVGAGSTFRIILPGVRATA